MKSSVQASMEISGAAYEQALLEPATLSLETIMPCFRPSGDLHSGQAATELAAGQAGGDRPKMQAWRLWKDK